MSERGAEAAAISPLIAHPRCWHHVPVPMPDSKPPRKRPRFDACRGWRPGDGRINCAVDNQLIMHG